MVLQQRWRDDTLNIFIRIIVAHLLGDFVFQPRRLLDSKSQPFGLLLHGAIVTALTVLLTGQPDPSFILAVLISHVAIDALKVHVLGDSAAAFVTDQVLHILTLAIIAWWLPEIQGPGFWSHFLTGSQQATGMRLLIIIGGYIVCCLVGGVLIGRITVGIEPDQSSEGIPGAGQWIGWLERLIVMTLVLADEMSGIGFLIAAKSILRFGQTSADQQPNHRADRKASEYIIIGTFLSFGWALLTAILTRQLLALLP